MNPRLVLIARNILYFASFASGLRRRNSSLAARSEVYEWAVDAIRGLLREARVVAGEGPARDALDAVAEATERVSAARGNVRGALVRALVRRASALVHAAVGPGLATRLYWTVERVAEMVQRLSLSLASGFLLVWLIFGTALVRSVVLQSAAGLWSFAAFSAVVLGVVFGLSPLGLAPFWNPLALPPDERSRAWPPVSAVKQVLARFAALLLGFSATVAALMLLAPAETTFRTPFVATTMLFALLAIGHGFDTWDYFDPRPIRFVASIVSALLVWAGLGYAPDSPWLALPSEPRAGRPTAALPAGSGAVTPWIESHHWPRPGDGPVVVVAASGGGSRAAMFAASALLAIDREVPPVSSAIQSVSGVSGGSLAMAGYVAMRLGRVDPEGYRAAMEADYVWPLLRAIVTRDDRAAAVETDWRARLRLPGVTLASLARSWTAGDARFPVPVLNSADMLGHPVLLSPFSPRIFDADDRSRCGEDSGEGDPWVCDRDASHTLQEIAPGMDVPLLSAVRASANFPLAFPLIPVRAAHALMGHEHLSDPRSTRITDGGVFLNSGVQGLYPLLLHERDELRRRGVLMILLDASAAHAYSTLPGEWQIMSALKGAGVGRGQMLHRLMVTRLASELGARFGCVLVDMHPTALSRIPTSWYLDSEARQAMRHHFDSARWRSQRQQIESAFTAVGSGVGGGAYVSSCLARPPLY